VATVAHAAPLIDQAGISQAFSARLHARAAAVIAA
jgi:hypothetical protein